jgi:hypothetical protein
VLVCLVAGLVLTVAAIAFDLSRVPLVAANPTPASSQTGVTVLHKKTSVCQAAETMPKGTTAIRVPLFAVLGPAVSISVTQGRRLIAHAKHAAGWMGGSVTVPLSKQARTTFDATVCAMVPANAYEPIVLRTSPAKKSTATIGAKPIRGHIAIEYLSPDRSSWLSLVPEVARRMGLGRAWGGTWIVLLVVLMMGGLVVVCSLSIIREM